MAPRFSKIVKFAPEINKYILRRQQNLKKKLWPSRNVSNLPLISSAFFQISVCFQYLYVVQNSSILDMFQAKRKWFTYLY